MSFSRSRSGKDQPAGEYVVFHERLFPKRLDRAFRVGAIVVATGAFVATGALMLAAAPHTPPGAEGWGLVGAMCAIIAALAYGFTRAIGMVVVGIYGGLQRKQYVVDWDDGRDR